MAIEAKLNSWAPRILSVLRIFTGLIFLAHGTGKLFGFPVVPMFAKYQLDASPLGLSGPIELIGGLLFTLGLFTRPTAFILSGFSAAAYFLAHAPKSFFPVLNGGELAVVACFVFLYFVFAGPGPWSLDAARNKA